MPALRYLLFLPLICLPAKARSATVAIWDREAAESAFVSLLDAHYSSYKEIVADPQPDLTAHAVYLAIILAYAALLTGRLPHSRAYAARAARAMSRTRATIARNPFERCADK